MILRFFKKPCGCVTTLIIIGFFIWLISNNWSL